MAVNNSQLTGDDWIKMFLKILLPKIFIEHMSFPSDVQVFQIQQQTKQIHSLITALLTGHSLVFSQFFPSILWISKGQSYVPFFFIYLVICLMPGIFKCLLNYISHRLFGTVGKYLNFTHHTSKYLIAQQRIHTESYITVLINLPEVNQKERI